MKKKNISEICFEKYLNSREIAWEFEKFPGRKPDYLLHLKSGDVICEVKEIDETVDVKAMNNFMDKIRQEIRKLNFPFPVFCRCSDACSIGTLKMFLKFISKYRDFIIGEMKIGDRVTLGEGYYTDLVKLVIIEELENMGCRFYTLETASGKYPLIKNTDYHDYGLHERFRVILNESVFTAELSKVSNYKDPLLEIERINLEGKPVVGPSRAYSIDRAAQMRGPVKKAGIQIRPYKNENLSFVLVFYSKGGFNISSEDILELMFGKLTISFLVSPDPKFEPKRGTTFYGKGAMMKGKNTSFSAVSSLCQESQDKFYLVTVHNPSARNRLSFDVFNGPMDKQYYIDQKLKQAIEYKS